MRSLANELHSEINRLASVSARREGVTHVDKRGSAELECPGLAVISSRFPAHRREVLAIIIGEALVTERSIDSELVHKKLIAFANGTQGILMREVLANLSDVMLNNLDKGFLNDEDRYQVSESVRFLEGCTNLTWMTAPISTSDVLLVLSECQEGCVVIIENFHFVHGDGVANSALAEIRNCAKERGVFIYVGIGLSHWPEVRKSGQDMLYLTDLPEGYTQIVDVVDKITILAPCDDGARAVIYDPRYILPQRCVWELDA